MATTDYRAHTAYVAMSCLKELGYDGVAAELLAKEGMNDEQIDELLSDMEVDDGGN